MAKLTKIGQSWYLSFMRNGRGQRKSLGKISEEVAQQALEQFALGYEPASRRSLLVLDTKDIHQLWRKSRERARERNIDYHLNFAAIRAMYERSKGFCEVSGIQFNRDLPPGCTKRPWYPSIDRIDSRGIYVPENCRLVCVAANIAMCEWGLETLKRLSRALILGQGEKTEVTQFLRNEKRMPLIRNQIPG